MACEHGHTGRKGSRKEGITGSAFIMLTAPDLRTSYITHAFRSLYRLVPRKAATVIDLRHSLDFLPEPYTIPGALRIPMEDLDKRDHEIPEGRKWCCTVPVRMKPAAP